MKVKNIFFLCSLSIIAIYAILITLYSTTKGTGITTDSVRYASAAINLLSGKGLLEFSETAHIVPLTHYPPGYPLILAAFASLRGKDEVWTTGRYLNVFLFGANSLIIGISVFILSNKNHLLSIICSLIFCCSPSLLYIHSMLWSEPSFIFVSLLGVSLFLYGFKNKKTDILFLSALLIALSFLIKYIGLVLVISSMAFLLIHEFPSSRKGKKTFLAFMSITVFPVIMWLLYAYIHKTDIEGRAFSFHPSSQLCFRQIMQTLNSWFCLNTGTGKVFLAFICFLIFWIIYKTLKIVGFNKSRGMDVPFNFHKILNLFLFQTFYIIYIPLFFIMLFLTINFFDLQTLPDERILSFVFALTVIMIAMLSNGIVDIFKINKRIKIMAGVVLMFFLAEYLYLSTATAKILSNEGAGYNSDSWKNSKIVSILKDKKCDVVVYSNVPDAIYFLNKMISRMIPYKYDPYTGGINSNYDKETRVMRSEIEKKNAILILFKKIGARRYLPKEDEIRRDMNLKIIYQCEDETAYSII